MSERDFKGVWIPKEIWENEDLTLIEKAILIEIDSLDNENHCIASNEYLAKFCQCSERKVSEAVTKLANLGFIEILKFNGRCRTIKSLLRDRALCSMQGSKICESASQKVLSNNIENSKKEDNISNTKVLDTEKEEKENFLGSAKSVRKPKKQSLYDKCYAEILAFTNNAIIQEILTEYLKFRLSVKEKPLYLNQWRGMLNKLSELSEGDIDNMRRLAQQSLEKTWLSFYPLTNTKSKSTMLASCEKNVRSDRMTEDDEKKQSEFIQKLKEEGKRIEF